jgi:hypothetical protein
MDQIKAEWRCRCNAFARASGRSGGETKTEAARVASGEVTDWWRRHSGDYKALMAEWPRVKEEDIPW